jgi:hypothetical protein
MKRCYAACQQGPAAPRSPQEERVQEREVRVRGEEAAAPSRPSACPWVGHALAMASLSACVPSPPVAGGSTPSPPQPRSLRGLRAHRHRRTIRWRLIGGLVYICWRTRHLGTERPGAWFQAPLLLPPLLRSYSYLCCGTHPLPGNFFHSGLTVDYNLWLEESILKFYKNEGRGWGEGPLMSCEWWLQIRCSGSDAPASLRWSILQLVEGGRGPYCGVD